MVPPVKHQAPQDLVGAKELLITTWVSSGLTVSWLNDRTITLLIDVACVAELDV
jgi:hypothetical protein